MKPLIEGANISQSKITNTNMITQTTTIGSRNGQSTNNMDSIQVNNRVDESMNESENLETSRFS